MITPQRLFLANGVLRKFFMSGGWLPLSVRLVVDLDFTATELLLMGTSIELAILLGEVPTGVVADVFSRKWSVVIGTFMLAAAQFASGIVDEWTMYLVTQFVWGIGWTFLSGAEIAWVTDEVGGADEVEPLLLRRGRLQFAAVVAGIVTFGLLSFLLPLTTAVMIAGGLGMTWSLFLAVAMPETGFERSADNHWRTFATTLREGARFTWRVRGLRILGLALIVGGMAAEALDRLDLRRLQDLGLSDTISPVLVFGFVMAGKSLLGGLLLWRFEGHFRGKRVVTGFSTLLGLVGLAALLLAHVPVLGFAIVALLVQGSLLDVTDPLVGTWTNALAPSETRATVHSFIGQARALGEILGGASLAAVAYWTSLPVIWTVAAGLFLIAATLLHSAQDDWPTDNEMIRDGSKLGNL